MMNEERTSFDDDFDHEEDWTDTSWAQPNSHQQPAVGELKLVADKSASSASMPAAESGNKGAAQVDSTIVKRMLLNDNKAGMEGLDKEKINQIIHEASKGSRFYENERKKEEEMKRKIEEQKKKISSISEEQLKQGLNEADRLLEDFEQQRDLSHTIVHIDMDAFYAAVEMRDDPSLKNKPMAVGGNSMLSTSNYHARKFGVRAAMPGFIGKKLCPDLVIVPLNFDKYTTVSKQVKSLIAEYDPNFCPMSLDEAYLDITEHLITRKELTVEERTFICRKEIAESADVGYCFCDLNDVVKQTGDMEIEFNGEKISMKQYFSKSQDDFGVDENQNERPMCPMCGRPFPPFCHVTFGLSDEDTIRELRTRIEQKTRLTASAGIAPNMMLSKVCSDKNKPNGQYKIPAEREAVMGFIKNLPTRKISGIGKVSEAMLNAVGVYTCTDLYNKRGLLYHLYSQIFFNYFMRICLGIGSTTVERDSERKSISTERTFHELSKPADLYKKCEELVDSLIEDLKEEQLKGKTVSIKIKTVKFEVKTRAHTLPNYTNDRAAILQSALDLLKTEIQACFPQPLRLRLMGVRMANLANQSICKDEKKQGTILGAFKKIEDKAKTFTSEVIQLENNSIIKGGQMTFEKSSSKIREGVENGAQPIFAAFKKVEDKNNAVFNENTKPKDNSIVNGCQLTFEKSSGMIKEEEGDSGCRKSSFEPASNLPIGVLKVENLVERIIDDVNSDQLEVEIKSGLNMSGNSAINRCENLTTSDDQNQKDQIQNIKTKTEKLTDDNQVAAEQIICASSVSSDINENLAKIDNHNVRIQENVGNSKAPSASPKVSMELKEGSRTRSGLIRSSKKPSRKRRNSKPEKLVVYTCPICCKEISCASLTNFNEHVDECLDEGSVTENKSVINEVNASDFEHKPRNCSLKQVAVTKFSLQSNHTESGKLTCEIDNSVPLASDKGVVTSVLDTDENDNEKRQVVKTTDLSNDITKVHDKQTVNDTEKRDNTCESSRVEPSLSCNKFNKCEDVLVNLCAENQTDTLITDGSGTNVCEATDKDANNLSFSVECETETLTKEARNSSNTVEENCITNKSIDLDGSKIDLEMKQECIANSDNSNLELKSKESFTEIATETNTELIAEKELTEFEKGDSNQLENTTVNSSDTLNVVQLTDKTNCDNTNMMKDPNSSDLTNSKDISDIPELAKDPLSSSNTFPQPGCSWMSDDVSNDADGDNDGSEGLLVCPVCNVEQRSADLNEFNSHVDSCLSRGAITQILKEQNNNSGFTLKRDRDVKKTPNHAPPTKKRKTILPNKSPSSCRTILSFFKDSQSV